MTFEAFDPLIVREQIEKHGVCRDFTGLSQTELDKHVRAIASVVTRARRRPLVYARKPRWAL